MTRGLRKINLCPAQESSPTGGHDAAVTDSDGEIRDGLEKGRLASARLSHRVLLDDGLEADAVDIDDQEWRGDCR